MAHSTRQILLVLALFLASGIISVHADEMYTTTTHVTFDKNGIAPRDPVSFAMNCYGFTCQGWDCKAPGDGVKASDYASDLAFSFHATCPGYGCDVYEPYYHTERLKIDHCDIEGTVGGQPFLIRNYSMTPVPDCSWQEWMVDRGQNGNLTFSTPTPRYLECMNASYPASDACDVYLAPCDPLKDTNCTGTWMMNDSYVKSTPAWDACKEKVRSDREQCSRYLEPLNYSRYALDEQGMPSQRSCELRITLPSDTRTGNISTGTVSDTANRTTPADGIFCFLNRLLGGIC